MWPSENVYSRCLRNKKHLFATPLWPMIANSASINFPYNSNSIARRQVSTCLSRRIHDKPKNLFLASALDVVPDINPDVEGTELLIESTEQYHGYIPTVATTNTHHQHLYPRQNRTTWLYSTFLKLVHLQVTTKSNKGSLLLTGSAPSKDTRCFSIRKITRQ